MEDPNVEICQETNCSNDRSHCRHQDSTAETVLDQAKGAPQGPGLEQLNKADLAARAAQIVQGTGWLPSPLRPASNDNASSEAVIREAAE
jgi:hypothetical protein